jgi:hypothetical protein
LTGQDKFAICTFRGFIVGRIISNLFVFFAATTLIASNAVAHGVPMTVMRADFGTLSVKHRLDITQLIQDFCDCGGSNCTVFCSATSFGGRQAGSNAICRVIYRRPNGDTRSAEAALEEMIMLRCPAAPASAALLDTIEPPHYQPPGQ